MRNGINKSERIVGIDVARAIAVIGMIIVNFKVVLGSEGQGWLLTIADSLSGKAAALFVVLAGVGIALLTKNSYGSKDIKVIHRYRIKLFKRSLLLFLIGLSYMALWPADILHFYGVYMLITLVFVSSSKRMILSVASVIILLYPLMMNFINYDIGWNFETLDYTGFWTLNGFFLNLFYNGFHPVFPWVAFMLIGLWYGRHDLHNPRIVRRLMWKGLAGLIVVLLLSQALLHMSKFLDPIESNGLTALLGFSPMPPLPLYMFAGCFLSISVIGFCILFAKRFESIFLVSWLVRTGRLALTLYVAHVVVGMSLAYAYDETMIGKHSIQFTLLYAIGFSLLSVIFSNVWLNYFKSGPLEWLFKRILG